MWWGGEVGWGTSKKEQRCCRPQVLIKTALLELADVEQSSRSEAQAQAILPLASSPLPCALRHMALRGVGDGLPHESMCLAHDAEGCAESSGSDHKVCSGPQLLLSASLRSSIISRCASQDGSSHGSQLGASSGGLPWRAAVVCPASGARCGVPPDRTSVGFRGVAKKTRECARVARLVRISAGASAVRPRCSCCLECTSVLCLSR